jgi:hypothetical protein
MAVHTFDFREDDAALLWLDGRSIEGTRILEHLCLVQVEQRPAVLVLLVKVHLLQSHQHTAHRQVETIEGGTVSFDGWKRRGTANEKIRAKLQCQPQSRVGTSVPSKTTIEQATILLGLL